MEVGSNLQSMGSVRVPSSCFLCWKPLSGWAPAPCGEELVSWCVLVEQPRGWLGSWAQPARWSCLSLFTPGQGKALSSSLSESIV